MTRKRRHTDKGSGRIFDFMIETTDGWRLTADECQWIVRRPRQRDGVTIWHPRSFVGSNKRMLRLILRSLGVGTGIVTNPTLHAFLSEEPANFQDWATHRRRQPQPACGCV